MNEPKPDPAAPGRLDKNARARHFNELRELHKLYSKHEPRPLAWNHMGDPIIGMCICGRLCVCPPLGRWRVANHADKRNLNRNPKTRALLKKALRELPYA